MTADLSSHPSFAKLISLGLPEDDFAVFGSGPMFAHGLRERIGDIDVIAGPRAWKQALKKGEAGLSASGSRKVSFADGEIEVFDSWAPGEWDIDALIGEAEVIDGVRFVRLEHVLRWKRMMGREKDESDIKALASHLAEGRDR